MNNEELKKKIIEIMSNVWSLPVPCTAERKFERIADALIEDVVGDVKEAERKAFVYSKEITHLDKKLQEARCRVEVAERALKNACVRLTSDDGVLCSFEMGYGWFCPHVKTSCEECYVDWFIKQAEKELEGERKDEQS